MSFSVKKTTKKRLARKLDDSIVDYDQVEPPQKQEATGELQIINYTDRSIVVIGDTLSHSNALGTLGGKFNPNLRVGQGWIFAKMREDSVRKYIETGEIEPYVYDKAAYNKKPALNKETLQKLFREFREAFDADEEYEGESIMDVIQQLEDKWMASL